MSLCNDCRAGSENAYLRLTLAHGWGRHQIAGWELDIIGGMRPSDATWLRAMWRMPASIPRREFPMVEGFTAWLAGHGWTIERASETDTVFRLVQIAP